jgi:FKBP-type peptidyl-prolyl cis-trans isomerase FkpA
MNIKTHLGLLIGVILFTVFSCSQEPKISMTKHGFPVQMIQDVSGEPASEGEVLFFKMKVLAGDSLLFSSFEQKEAQEYKWPNAEQLEKMVDPVIDAFALMSAGDSLMVRMPKDSLKGRDFGLKEGQFLDYHLKVEKIMGADEYNTFVSDRQQKQQAEMAVVQAQEASIAELVKNTIADYKGGKLSSTLQKTDSGLEYIVHEEGNGVVPAKNEQVNVHYYGVLKSDGSMFDNSFKRGTPFGFNLGRGMVIPGWDEGVALLKKGSKATLFIPFESAYGAAGRPPQIPEKSDLVFYIEVLN